MTDRQVWSERGRRRADGSSICALAFAVLTFWSCAGDETGSNGASTASGQSSASSSGGVAAASRPGGVDAGRFGFGSPASVADIAAWDIDIAPDGAGLPPGQGTVRQGLQIYQTKCVACHGPTGREGPFDVLAGRAEGDEFTFATEPTVRSTIGSYWPYATTLFDYTRKAMPFDFPGSLTDEEVYALVGAMLFFNDLLPEDAVVDSATVAGMQMPARDRFVPDDRTGGPEIR